MCSEINDTTKNLPGVPVPSAPAAVPVLQTPAAVPAKTDPPALPGAQAPQKPQEPPKKPQETAVPKELPEKVAIQGKDDLSQRYFNIYASLPQTVGAANAPNDAVLLDKQNAVSEGDFDLTLAATTGQVTFLKHGIYQISWYLHARITPPVPTPAPSWSFGIWINGTLAPGNVQSGFHPTAVSDACYSAGGFQIELKAGDTLLLKNTSTSSVDLSPSVTGSSFPFTSASVCVRGLKALA